ncbi:hypothetical protein L2E82_31511 [Cichorium intybus]|uniref:Uncharacterized protein n=1 Tax=Cichorium intybus TaxID=13427 RepID=A0ACB9BDC1_CICIN|nr:hypothetical protein L2E82_31511 [Cichorium intybus]
MQRVVTVCRCQCSFTTCRFFVQERFFKPGGQIDIKDALEWRWASIYPDWSIELRFLCGLVLAGSELEVRGRSSHIGEEKDLLSYPDSVPVSGFGSPGDIFGYCLEFGRIYPCSFSSL